MCLRKLQRAVNKGAVTYLQHDQIQRDVCQCLIHLLIQYQSTFETIADIACGVGASTQQLIQSVKARHYIATDLSPEALYVAKQRLLNYIHMIQADFHVPLLFGLDLVFCNMGLHWSGNLKQALKTIAASLNAHGILAFSLPVTGTFVELKPEYRLNFTTAESILHLLHDLGFTLLKTEMYDKTFHFPNKLAALRSLKYTGTHINFKESIKHLHTKKHIDNYFVNISQSQLTYQVALFIVRKQ